MVHKNMVLPILEYGNILLSSVKNETKKRIQVLQSKALGGSGWPTSLRRRRFMLTLRSLGFESRDQQKEKRTLGTPLHRRCPNCAAGSQWKTGDVKPY